LLALKLMTDGTMQVLGGLALGLVGTLAALPLNQVVRLEWKIVHGATGSIEVRAFYTGSAEGAVGSWDDRVTGATDNGPFAEDQITFGNTNGAATNWPTATGSLWLDDVAHGAGDWLGPSGVSATPISSSDASGVATEAGTLVAVESATDASGIDTEAASLVASETAADASGTSTETGAVVSAVPAADASGKLDRARNLGCRDPLDGRLGCRYRDHDSLPSVRG
jgi:hypothetical protein